LDGYYYPTQPGDVNDRRTWCTVEAEEVDSAGYHCIAENISEGEFGVRYRVVEGFTFHESEQLDATKFYGPFKDALFDLLTDPEVCAITCSVGFCSGFQTVVENATNDLVKEYQVPRKPTLLGAPAMMAAFSPTIYGESINWGLIEDPKKDRVIILTSFYPTMEENMKDIMEAVGIPMQCHGKGCHGRAFEKRLARQLLKSLSLNVPQGRGDAGVRVLGELMEALGNDGGNAKEVAKFAKNAAKMFVPIGWNNMPGYIPVDVGGGFHNTWLTLQHYREQLTSTINQMHAAGLRVKGVIMESTEMPAHANDIRRHYHLPTWDISTLGQCLMKAHKTFNKSDENMYTALFQNAEFKECMLSWWSAKPLRLEPKFGTQLDGQLKFFENLNTSELQNLTCTGGRPGPGKYPIGRRMDLYDVGSPRGSSLGVIPQVCQTTALCSCASDVPAPGPGCPGPCPGSGNCGGGPWGEQMTLPQGTFGYPCGMHGELCPSEELVPPLLTNPEQFRNPGNGNACPDPANSQRDSWQWSF